MEVWTFFISHRHGEGTTVHRTEAAAMTAVREWVGEWWGYERERYDLPEAIPTDDETAIALYFDATDENFLVEPAQLALTYDDVKNAAIALSKDEQYRLCHELDLALGSFTMVSLEVDAFRENISDGNFEDLGVPSYGVLEDDAYGALHHVSRKASAPDDYVSDLEEWAVQNLIDDGYTPLLVPIWCAGMGG